MKGLPPNGPAVHRELHHRTAYHYLGCFRHDLKAREQSPDGRSTAVIYAVSYDEERDTPNKPHMIRTVSDATRAALELTRDEGRGQTPWRVFGTVTGEWSDFAQSELEQPSLD